MIILKATKQERYLFIWVAHADAYILGSKFQGKVSPRPLSHDLFKDILDGLGATITMAIITKEIEIPEKSSNIIGVNSSLKDDIMYARVRLKIANKEREFDSRPSDAIIFSIYSGSPVFIEKQLLDTEGVTLEVEEESRG